MSNHLNDQQNHAWHQALAAVREVAANTDTESASKQPLMHLAEHVRRQPQVIVRELALI